VECQLELRYGDQTLEFSLPRRDSVYFLAPGSVSACVDPQQEIKKALDQPIDTLPVRGLVHSGEKVLILVDDHTRTTPVAMILPHLLQRLRSSGIEDENVTIMIANGAHRLSSDAEVRHKVGERIHRQYRIVQHRCCDEHSHVYLGLTSRGTPVWVDRRAVETDHCFGIGHIDPSTFAGYSGGHKLIIPGIASLDTIDANHSLVPLGFRRHGRVDVPCRLDLEEAAAMLKVDLLVNVVLCQDGRIARAFAGSPSSVFREGVRVARQIYEVACPGPMDVAIASGHPYDIDLYQAARAVQFADGIVREGGSIVLVARCSDGFGDPDFYRLLTEPRKPPEDFLCGMVRRNGKVTYNVLGYFLARIRAEKTLYAVTEDISREALLAAGFTSSSSLQARVRALLEEYGPRARIAVLPSGSATVPRL
jgi:nickel-dependent lactate racemase